MRLPYSSASKKFSNLLVNKIKDYTNGKGKLVKTWNTSKIQSLFNYKDKVQHHNRAICCGVCSCDADYIGETIREIPT